MLSQLYLLMRSQSDSMMQQDCLLFVWPAEVLQLWLSGQWDTSMIMHKLSECLLSYRLFFLFSFFLPEIQNPHTTDSRDPSGWAGVGQASICLWFWLIPCSVWRQSSLMKWMILIICHVACGVHPYCALHSARASLDTVIPLADSKWTGIIKGKNNKRKCFVILTVGQDV